jgi:hypothetical protein
MPNLPRRPWLLRLGSPRADGRRWKTGSPTAAGATRLIDGLLTTGLCVGLAALLPASLTGPALAALLGAAGGLWLAVAVTGDEARFASRRATASAADSRAVTAWDMALVFLAAGAAVRTAALPWP